MSVTHKGAPTFEIKGDPAPPSVGGLLSCVIVRPILRESRGHCKISVSGWSGRAAERFHEHFKLQPENGGAPQRLSAVLQMPGKPRVGARASSNACF